MATVAFLVDDTFEDSEMRVPYDRVVDAGHEVVVVGVEDGKQVEGKRKKERFTVDEAVDEVDVEQFDALVIPGGYSPDRLRTNESAVDFTRRMAEADKLVAAVCHGGSLLIEAGVVSGKTVTSWPSIKTDLENAGARWVDREVVEDGNLVTSRRPDDLEAFSDAILEHLEDVGAAERSNGANRTKGRGRKTKPAARPTKRSAALAGTTRSRSHR